MKINDIVLTEAVDQVEASQLYTALISSNDPYLKRIAYYFQSTRNDQKHTTVDSAQQAAEGMVRREMLNMPNKDSRMERTAQERDNGKEISDIVKQRMLKKSQLKTQQSGANGRGQYTKYKDGTDRKSSRGTTAKELIKKIIPTGPDLRGPVTSATSGFGIGKDIANKFNRPASRT
tara:strand:- start:1578 stop:2105 length:528 start_codon:yes stop_codon:yes gene_type:complete